MPELTIRNWPVAEWTALPLEAGQVAMWWLGQAGFALRLGDARMLIDPYLSDSLARKYIGRQFAHRRLMPAPLDAKAIRGLQWVFCTHAHGDHMDPDTLEPLARNNPDCRFVVPRADAHVAAERGVPEAAIVGINDGETVELAAHAAVEAVAAAHEAPRTNERGEHHFLGYVLRLGGMRVFHGGDGVPYAGLDERLAGKNIDAALLPVNGRDEYRTSRGIIGNFTFDEAADLCWRTAIPLLVAHHFGMFDFNTVDPAELDHKVRRPELATRTIIPAVDKVYLLSCREAGR